mmetsp:Transcript_18608/g.25069  ORF Transcript_18608/g.25069 Transcript_18608/m.25069 type:complete len:218 (-) Transcript_18608:809-1462(-)|eukprot:CAMPEP_0185589486 /NCGR_PEP_ID=MMETSP0434-20130131/57263_1 /TAXON_ID=626734 ORGANISM="Favella taraikaensis, Strain Fe Narragansett Bay" /NCGR_SAMPLE_ID=MMETSP0434 /ASSEMBLY_ACC=CAM_ASM_000379 /LENGTH=217 /DNA_ID=CAMNT_0028212913 /DNA_START=1731 /DNA_END=2384 /DNA_ORIENTATION=-
MSLRRLGWALLLTVICSWWQLILCRCGYLPAVDLASGVEDALLLMLITRLVISTQRVSPLAAIAGHDSSGVAYVSDVAHFLDDEHDDGAGAASVYDKCPTVSVLRRCVVLCPAFLGLGEAQFEGLTWVIREARLPHDIRVQVVAQEVRTLAPPVPIVYPEEGADGPGRGFTTRRAEFSARLGLRDVQDDRNSVFVVVAHQTLMRVGSVASDYAVASH